MVGTVDSTSKKINNYTNSVKNNTQINITKADSNANVSVLHRYYFHKNINNGSPILVDKFGVREIYPTKTGGREWFLLNNSDFEADGIFMPANHNISKQADGSWQSIDPAVRVKVSTPSGATPWKNVEITGYLKVLNIIYPLKHNRSSNNIENNSTLNRNNNNSTQSDQKNKKENNDLTNNPAIVWYARSGRHNNNAPCEGTSLKGGIDVNGTAFWQKEIWHTGGYTASKHTKVNIINNSILGRWIGWKVVIYNINNNSDVKMESYLDDRKNNNWTKVENLVDNGSWNATSSDREFYSANCNKPRDYVVTNSGPIVGFRSDYIKWNFKDLSVREIQPPSVVLKTANITNFLSTKSDDTTYNSNSMSPK